MGGIQEILEVFLSEVIYSQSHLIAPKVAGFDIPS